MIVAHVLSSLHIGGQERVALELAGGQAEARHAVMVVSLAPEPDGPLGEAFRARGVAVHRVSKGEGLDPTLPLRLAALFHRERVTVVHTHNRMPLIYGAPAGRLVGAVVVHTRHGPARGSVQERWLRRSVGKLVHAYVSVSPALRVLAESLRDCAPRKMSVIENGIDVERFGAAGVDRQRAREALGIPADAYVIGSVGRLATEKDYPMLVRAAAPLLGPSTRLVIVGDGAEAGTIRAAVAAGGVEPYVIMPGARDDVPRWIAALDVFVLSSQMEGLPLVALEAMAAGRPVVATAVGGLPNLIQDGVTGFLIPAGDEQAMRQRLAALRDDPATAAAVAARGQAHARAHHSREAMVRNYLELYGRVGAR
jgi:glycosyltransferase involved in cell wall biosynthesis